MKRVLTWFAENTVAANLLMMMILAGGLLTMRHLKMEIFPELSSGFVSVSVEYLGASPEEVEEAICIRIEEEVQDVDGVKRLTSTSTEGLGVVNLEMHHDADSRRVLDDVKSRVDAIDTFPEEAEKPIVQEIIGRHQVINVALHGEAEETTLKFLGEQVRDEVSALPGITHVKLALARPYEISIEISEEAMRRHDLSFDQVAAAIRSSSLDLPAGSLKTPDGQILLRTKTQAYRGADFERLALITKPDGTRLTLGDVARVIDGFEDTDQSARFDGQPAVVLQVYRVGDQNALTISNAVADYVKEATSRLPDGLALTTWQDNSEYLRGRRDLLCRNALYGLILVFTILTLFLRFKLAVWVCVGLAVSFLGAIWLMPTLDVSINMISLFAFILALGVVVDDAIVVGENIFSHQKRGGDKIEAAVNGVLEVSVPVIFAVLTSVAAMLPLLTISGTTGKIMAVVPLIFIPALLFSLVESLLILPAHLAHGVSERRPVALVRAWLRFQGLFSKLLELFVERVYRPFLDQAIEWRYLTLAVGLAILILTAGLVRGGHIRFIFFPDAVADYVTATVDMPQGTAVEETTDAIRRLETSARQLEAEIQDEFGANANPFRHILTSVGEQPQKTIQALKAGLIGLTFAGSHLGEVTIELQPSEERVIETQRVVDRWRELTRPIAGTQDLTFTAKIFSPGAAIDVQLSHPNLDKLERASEELKAILGTYAGAYNISDSHQPGKTEVRIRTKETAEPLGLTQLDVARQVRQGFYGEECQRVQRDRDDVKVMVRYPRDERSSLGDLENMRIRTPAGLEVPFSLVASTEIGRGYAAIRRADRRRTINVKADVDKSVGNANEILGHVVAQELPALKAAFPRLTYSFEGQRREQSETLDQLFTGFVLALLMIYALLAVPFKSYIQPFIVLSAIPFGLVGAVLGHLVLGMELTILSMFGIVALAGVVVNDSLVLVDYINRRRRDGMPVIEAVRVGGAARFRPILLTSLTTFAGLTPLLLEKSVQARFLIPMGISLAFGVMFSTLITLVLVPAAYLLLEDLGTLLRAFRDHWLELLGAGGKADEMRIEDTAHGPTRVGTD